MIKDCREKIESAQSLWNHSQCWHNVVLLSVWPITKKFSILTGKEVCVESGERWRKTHPKMSTSEVIRWHPAIRCLGTLVVITSLLAQMVSTNPQQSFNPLKIDQGLVPFPQGKPKFNKSRHFGEMNSSTFKSSSRSIAGQISVRRKCLLKHLERNRTETKSLNPFFRFFCPLTQMDFSPNSTKVWFKSAKNLSSFFSKSHDGIAENLRGKKPP